MPLSPSEQCAFRKFQLISSLNRAKGRLHPYGQKSGLDQTIPASAGSYRWLRLHHQSTGGPVCPCPAHTVGVGKVASLSARLPGSSDCCTKDSILPQPGGC